jgi:hypothetical protein
MSRKDTLINKAKKGTTPASLSARIDRKLIESFAKEHKIEFPTAEKVLWMSLVLQRIASSPIGKDFALMGGSAIVFLYRDMYRLSTDLDLDFIGNKNLGKKGTREIKERQDSDKAVFEQIAHDLSMRFVSEQQVDERFVQYGLGFKSWYTRIGVVELDISYRYCHSVLDPVTLPWPITYPDIIPSFKVQSLRIGELYASKVLAMVDAKERLDFPSQFGLMFKRKVRHLFDVYVLAEEVMAGRVKMDKQLRDLVLLFGMTRIKNFEYFRGGDVISLYTDAHVSSELLAVVPRGVTIPLVDEMKWMVRRFFDIHVFNWAQREHRFIEDFRARNFRPEDLFGPGTIATRLHGTQYYKEILGKVRTLASKKPRI